MKGEKGGSSVLEKGTIRMTQTPPHCLHYFDKKNGRNYAEKNRNVILDHETNEWTKGIGTTSTKVRTYQQV